MHTFAEDIQWMLRDTNPFALYAAGIAIVFLILYVITKWREFFMIGLTAGIYVIPFLMSTGHGVHNP